MSVASFKPQIKARICRVYKSSTWCFMQHIMLKVCSKFLLDYYWLFSLIEGLLATIFYRGAPTETQELPARLTNKWDKPEPKLTQSLSDTLTIIPRLRFYLSEYFNNINLRILFLSNGRTIYAVMATPIDPKSDLPALKPSLFQYVNGRIFWTIIQA